MGCQNEKCKSDRLLSVSGKVSDMGFFSVGEREHDGYVPRDLGVGGGDYIEFTFCLECGQMRGTWPLPPSKLEGTKENEDDEG